MIIIIIMIITRASPAILRERTLKPRRFQGSCLKDNVKGLQFEETKTQICLNRKLINIIMIRRKVKTVSLKSLNHPSCTSGSPPLTLPRP